MFLWPRLIVPFASCITCFQTFRWEATRVAQQRFSNFLCSARAYSHTFRKLCSSRLESQIPKLKQTYHSNSIPVKWSVASLKMVSTTIRLNRDDLSPPIFLAGTFTEWQPSLEMEQEIVDDQSGGRSHFYKLVELSAGTHQYKFRLGHGDWWVVDDSTPTGMQQDTIYKRTFSETTQKPTASETSTMWSMLRSRRAQKSPPRS